MRMTTTIAVPMALVGVLVWAALPAEADDEKSRIAELEATIVRMEAESAHWREAYTQLTGNATRAARAVAGLTHSINASRALIAAQQQELAAMRAAIEARPTDDPLRLKLALQDAQREHLERVNALQQQLAEMTARLAEARTAHEEVQAALEAEQRRRVEDIVRLQQALTDTVEHANRNAVRMTEAESELAQVKAKLAKAEGTIEVLRAGK